MGVEGLDVKLVAIGVGWLLKTMKEEDDAGTQNAVSHLNRHMLLSIVPTNVLLKTHNGNCRCSEPQDSIKAAGSTGGLSHANFFINP